MKCHMSCCISHVDTLATIVMSCHVMSSSHLLASGYRPHAASHHDPDPPSDDEDTLANEIVAEALDHARMFP